MTCPNPLPPFYLKWETWRLAGGIKAERPHGLPQRIPQTWWACLRERRPKPVYVLPFPPPVAFYRAPDDSTIGPSEAIPQWKAVGGKAIAIDPLQGGDWTDWIRLARADGLKVYGWTRVYAISTWAQFLDSSGGLNLDGSFPNVEDDDLRLARDMVGIKEFLQYVAKPFGDEPPLMGVLSNYFVSDEWPTPNPLGHLPVLPEWFPREITDPSATLEGSLASGRKHFAAAIPLLDGRESRGLAAFPYPAGAFSIWPADNVADWGVWKR